MRPRALVLALLLLAACGGDGAAAAERRQAAVYLLRGERLAPSARPVSVPAVASSSLRALLGGPTRAERAAGLATAIPAGTRLRSVRIDDGTATVDLSGRFASGGGSLSMAARLAQVTYTLTQFPSVRRVVYRLDGKRITALGGEGLDVSRPQTRALYETARPGSLEGGLLGPVFVDRPARGSPYARLLRVEGSATRTFTLTVVDWDGRIVAGRTVRVAGGRRARFGVRFALPRSLYPRGALIVRIARGETFELALGR
jgi:hypothetical protein